MRVIAGEFRSRRLKTMAGLALRPTPDRLREALFNVLAPRIAGVTFLDAYAGSGSVGIEALSRGASHAVFVVQRASLAALGEWDADIYFLDPPYTLTDEYRSTLTLLGERTLRPQASVLVQH